MLIRRSLDGTELSLARFKTADKQNVTILVVLNRLESTNDQPSALDLLVLTSRREGFPLAALEARACGVALVGLDRPGVREALAGGDCGVLVPPESSPVDLATAVQSLLEDARRRHHYVAQGLSNLWAYHPDRVATALTQHYAAVLADSPARAAVAGTRLG